MLTALSDDRNWNASLPANTHHTVTLRKLVLPPTQIVLHPFGVLSVSQKVAPLGVEINKFGNQKPTGTTLFDLTFSEGGTEEAREEFAMANFLQMDDTEKLSRKSFEKMRSGLRFAAGDSSKYGANALKEVNYELSYLGRSRGQTIKAGIFQLFSSVFSILVKGGASVKNVFSVSKFNGGTPPVRIEVESPKYAIVHAEDLSLYAEDMVAKTSTEAYLLHDRLVADGPSLQGKVLVVSSHELS